MASRARARSRSRIAVWCSRKIAASAVCRSIIFNIVKSLTTRAAYSKTVERTGRSDAVCSCGHDPEKPLLARVFPIPESLRALLAAARRAADVVRAVNFQRAGFRARRFERRAEAA